MIQRIEVQQNEKVKKNSGKLTALSFAELIELRSTTSEHHRFDPKHPKFQKDKKRFPFLAKFEIEEKDLKKSKMKSLVEALRKKNLSQEVQIQAYTGFMEVDAETNYLRATTGHTFHLGGYEKGVDRVKVLTQYKDRLNNIVQGNAKSSDAKKVSVTVKPPNAQPENSPAKEEKVQKTEVEIPVVTTEEIASASEAAQAPAPVTLVKQPEVSVKLKEGLNQLMRSNKCANLVALKQNVREKIEEIKSKSDDLAKETEGLYISSESVKLAKEKSEIINAFLATLQQATTDVEYYNIIAKFINSKEYEFLGQARNPIFQAMNWKGSSTGLIEDLHQVACEYVKNNSNNIKTTLM